MSEEWREIPGWEGAYEVSSHGRVRSMPRTTTRSDGVDVTLRGRIRRLCTDSGGYLYVSLSRPGFRTRVRIHPLVADLFLGIDRDEVVRHLDGNPKNNRVENLARGTHGDNVVDSVRHGTHRNTRKTQCPRGHLLVAPNLYWPRPGSRTCKSCNLARSARRKGNPLDLKTLADMKYRDLAVAK